MCKKILKSIDLYIDGEIPEQQRKYIKKHLEKCERCQIVYKNKLNRRNLLKKNFYNEHQITFFNEVEKQIDKNIGKEISYRKTIKTLKKQTYAASIVAIIFMLIILFSVIPYRQKNSNLNIADNSESETLIKYNNIEKNLHHIKNYSMVNIIGSHITYSQNIVYIPDPDFEKYGETQIKSGGRYPMIISTKNVVVSL